MSNIIPNLISGYTHPLYNTMSAEWRLWRDAYEGGWYFRDIYLEKFSTREDQGDYDQRRKMTPIATHAAACINEIRDSIFQRLADVVRTGGSQAYRESIAGMNLGVDMRGSTMNAFVGQKILQELLVMGRCGVYVDMPYLDATASLADTIGKRPYLYSYCVEDIIGWSYAKPDHPSEFKALLLRDADVGYDESKLFPCREICRYRKVWIDDATNLVNMLFLDEQGNPCDREGNPTDGTPIVLNLNRIPFVMPSIGFSLMRNIAGHQIALLNIGSTDVSYALKGNFTFYTEQKAQTPDHLRRGRGPDNTATTGGQGAEPREAPVGVTQGRYYAPQMERPGFIAPPSEPLMASMSLQAKIEADIRKLVHLAVQTMASRASAESKSMDNQGLESGLSFVGQVLENTELRVADFWSAYEDTAPARRKTATVMYPKRYSLKSDMDRINESSQLSSLCSKLTSNTARKEIQKQLATTLLGGKVSASTLAKIYQEIDDAPYVISDPTDLVAIHQEGLVGSEVATVALGFDKSQAKIAEQERVDRAASIIEAQSKAGTPPSNSDPAARGVPELSADPNASKQEKMNPDGTPKRVRGKGKKL